MCYRRPASGGRKGCLWPREQQVLKQRGQEDMHTQGLRHNVVLVEHTDTENGGRQGLGPMAL